MLKKETDFPLDAICVSCGVRYGGHFPYDIRIKNRCPGGRVTSFCPIDPELPAPAPHVANCGCPECRERVNSAPTRATTLPADPAERKKFPVASGVLNYFPDALVAVARVSYEGNQQHNPGEPLHWARGKSMDQDDTLIRHFLERGGRDTDGQRHTAKLAWRALALLQLEIEHDKAS